MSDRTILAASGSMKKLCSAEVVTLPLAGKKSYRIMMYTDSHTNDILLIWQGQNFVLCFFHDKSMKETVAKLEMFVSSSGVTCHFSLHAELSFRVKMEWHVHSILPLHMPFQTTHFLCRITPHAHFPPFLPTCFSL